MNYVNYKMALLKFGNNQIEDSFDLANNIDHEKYNERARVNKNIVSCLIDGVYSLAHQELSFRGHSQNRRLLRIPS